MLSMAQEKEVLKFDNLQHDFDKVKEEAGNISHTFYFINVSNDSVNIKNVATSCGCTASHWNNTAIMPNASDSIIVNYSTTNRVGGFSQAIVVHLNDTASAPIVIHINGEVLPRKISKADEYPIAIGNLRFKHTHISFGQVLNDSVALNTFPLFNNWDKPIEINLTELPPFLKTEMTSLVIPPDEEFFLTITYDAVLKNDWGLIFDKIYLKTNDSLNSQKLIYVSADIHENFSKLTLNDLKSAPVMDFENEVFYFDTIYNGKLVKTTFEFSNNGIQPLIVRKITSSCKCITHKLSADIIKTNKKRQIYVTFDTTGRLGYQRQTITVITNNPHRPIIKLSLEGYVM